ncbi:hypothetical protein HZB02_02575 [Candidatus Woesearchaeota archaeon]|nr:hypothetical protein [Candidatus Woesearchaeota archaeon]
MCPSDTTAVIQTDDDPYFANMTLGGEHWLTLSGGAGYCAHQSPPKTRVCKGTWNGADYFIEPSTESTDASLSSELTQDGLNIWRELILQNISRSYFDEHFTVVRFDSQVEGDILSMGIHYTFTYDWAGTGLTYAWNRSGMESDREAIPIKRNVGGVWISLNDSEIRELFQEQRNLLHENIQMIKPTEREIEGIISEAEARRKLQSCHQGMTIDDVRLTSANQTLFFTAEGKVNINTDQCNTNPLQNTYTIIEGRVNLVTGELTCQTTSQAPCAIEAPQQQQNTNQQSKGFFSRFFSWLQGLFD